MSNYPDFQIDSQWVTSRRGKKNQVDPFRPYGFFVEEERTRTGTIEEVATILLVNKECPYKCLMCDLWKNTTDRTIPLGAIPEQIKYALSKLPKTEHIKLYNSGSFFDQAAIPLADYKEIARLLEGFKTVVVESRPELINENALLFNEFLKSDLEIAIGLETVHLEVLQLLNKRMSLSDFERSIRLLNKNEISSRAFILLRPPFLSEQEGIHWAKKSIDYAFEVGVNSCIIIPVRSGNGAMEELESKGYFEAPDIKSIEKVVEYGIRLKKGNVFADLWDIERFSKCNKCHNERMNRLNHINLSQVLLPVVSCSCVI